MKRELVAILSGDVAGESRHDARNPELAKQNHAAYRDYICDSVEDHQGSRVEAEGNGLVFEFDSVLEALRCAVEVQRFLRDVNADVPQKARLSVQFGLHLSDLPEGGDQSLDAAIDIAERLMAMSEPGAVCISEAVFANVAASPEFAFKNLGEMRQRSGGAPTRAYGVVIPKPQAGRLSHENGTGRSSEHQRDSAVAVLPFENLGQDPQEDYLVDGLTDGVIAALANWRSFPVIARNSTFAYKGKAPDVRSVARDLGARYVLRGGVRQGDGRLSIDVEFVDASDGRCLWAENLDREMGDIFAVQEEITLHIAAMLVPALENAERSRLTASWPRHLTVWEYCLQGRAALERFSPEGNAQARALFEKAIALDPAYGQAYVGLAYSHHRDLWFEAAADRDAAIQALLQAARKAVTLDQADSEAYCILGFGLIWDRQFHLAIAAGEQAVACNPSNAIAYSQLGTALSFAGRPLEGVAKLECSLRLNAQDPRIHFVITMLARAHLNARNPEDAVRKAETAIVRNADYPLGHLVLAAALGHLGRVEQAHAALEECERLDPGFALRWALRPMYKNPGDDLYFLDGLRKAGLGVTAEVGKSGSL